MGTTIIDNLVEMSSMGEKRGDSRCACTTARLMQDYSKKFNSLDSNS